MRYSLLLRDQGRNADADMQMQLARAVDTAQADGWSNLITMGSLAAFTAARQDPALAPPADLLPAAAVLQFLDPFPEDEQK